MTKQTTFMTSSQLLIMRDNDTETIIRNGRIGIFEIVGSPFHFTRADIEVIFGTNLIAEWLDQKPVPETHGCMTQKRKAARNG